VTLLLVIDVAHPPRHPDQVEEELLAALREIRASPTLRILKVIHGHGSSGKGGSTREVVRNWSFRQSNRIRGIIAGEDFSLFDPATMQLRKEVGNFPDEDLGASNRGVTYLWVR